MSKIRKDIAERLALELSRRNLSARLLAEKCNISEDIISAYLKGEREIIIDEIKTICESANINSTRLLYSKNYPSVKLSYRNSAHKVESFASKIEDIFLIIKNSLPNWKAYEFSQKPQLSENIVDLINEAASFSNHFRSEFSNPLEFLISYSIPVLPIECSDVDFDSFLIREGKKLLICINTSRPSQRILFSLIHEISHILFDQATEVPVCTYIPNFYWKDKLTGIELHEYFAYKFAEFYLIPFTSVYPIAKNWPKIDIRLAQQLILTGNTTKEVLANAIFDTLKVSRANSFYNRESENNTFEPYGERYSDGQFENRYSSLDRFGISYSNIIKYLNTIKSGSEIEGLSSFLAQSRIDFKSIINNESTSLSEDIYCYILNTLKYDS